MQGQEDPKLLLACAEGKRVVLPPLSIHKLDRDLVRLDTHRLPPEVNGVERWTTLLRAGTTCSG